MYKSTARAEQFMTRTGNFATHGTRGGTALLGGGEKEQMTPDQQRAAIVAALKVINAEFQRMNAIPRPGLSAAEVKQISMRRRELGAQQAEFQIQLAAINPLCAERRKFQDMGHFIIEVVREQMTKPQWQVVLREAERRMNAQGSTPNEAAQPAAE